MAKYPADMAEVLTSWVLKNKSVYLPLAKITDLLEVMFFASLQTEEGEGIRCTVTYLDPQSENLVPSNREPMDRWGVAQLVEPIELDTRNLVKIAKAIDPLFSTAAAFVDSDGVMKIWGLTDQEIGFHRFTSRDFVTEPEHPGVFHVSIDAPGVISAFSGSSLIVTLAHDTLVRNLHKVLFNGPISQRLKRGAVQLLDENLLREDLVKELGEAYRVEKWLEQYRNGVGLAYANAVARILIRVQRYRHGGAILFVDSLNSDISPKFKYEYVRLQLIVEQYVRLKVLQRATNEYIKAGRLNEQSFASLQDTDQRLLGSARELEAAIAHIASLSRVDGAITLGDDLVVYGFGTIISTGNSNFDLYLARNTAGTEVVKGNRKGYGTRHGSMMAYCANHIDHIGFVVSQDGAVRAMMTVKGRLVMWENIALKFSKPVAKL